MAVAIVDLGVGNLNSVRWALERLGMPVTVTRDPSAVEAADGIVLPGVGHYAAAAYRLEQDGLGDAIRARAGSVPILGICLGMQLLFDRSEEGGRGLGLLPGRVTRLQAPGLPVPHVGWNTVQVRAAVGLLAAAGSGDAYFCHSYVVRPQDDLVGAAHTDYGEWFVSAVQQGLVTGVQFHPERSGAYGQRVLEQFGRQVQRCCSWSRLST
jgi:glutamine amidotransferase